MVRKFKTSKIEAEGEIVNPMDYIRLLQAKTRSWPRVKKRKCKHIRYDPDVKKDYYIIRQHRHDGTLYFTYDIIFRALLQLIRRTTFQKAKMKELFPEYSADNSRFLIDLSDKRVKKMKYIIGNITIVRVFKDSVELPCGNYPGEIERIRIPVKCDW